MSHDTPSPAAPQIVSLPTAEKPTGSRADSIDVRGLDHHVNLHHRFNDGSVALFMAHVPFTKTYSVWIQDLALGIVHGYDTYDHPLPAMVDYAERLGAITNHGETTDPCEIRHLYPAGVRCCLLCGRARVGAA